MTHRKQSWPIQLAVFLLALSLCCLVSVEVFFVHDDAAAVIASKLAAVFAAASLMIGVAGVLSGRLSERHPSGRGRAPTG